MKNSSTAVLTIQEASTKQPNRKVVRKKEEPSEATCNRAKLKAEGILCGLIESGMKSPWDKFLTVLVLEDSIDSRRAAKDFKNAVWLVAEVNEGLDKISWLAHERTSCREAVERLAERLIDAASTGTNEHYRNKDYRSFKVLLEMLEGELADNKVIDYWDWQEEDVVELKQDLQTILFANEILLNLRS